jgi:hypothetical protein
LKCPKDNKSCYIHYDADGFQRRCRHDNFVGAEIRPCDKEFAVFGKKKSEDEKDDVSSKTFSKIL